MPKTALIDHATRHAFKADGDTHFAERFNKCIGYGPQDDQRDEEHDDHWDGRGSD